MDLLKQLTGKNPAEYEQAAKILVDTPDVELFKKLVNQDEFLFDFIKNNVAKRIKNACNKNNYLNLIQFLDYYSPSYDDVIAEVLFVNGGENISDKMKEFLEKGNFSQKTYAVKFFTHFDNEKVQDIIPLVREYANSENEYLAAAAIEFLSKNNDTVSKMQAEKMLASEDEFEQYNAVKFLVTYGSKDVLPKIINVMKKSSFAENIAAEIPFLEDLEILLEKNFDDGLLVLCNIVNAIPEIIHPSSVIEYNLLEIFENLYYDNLTSSSALLLRMAKEKFASFEENEEYLFDCDKNTKDEISAINGFFAKVNENKLNSLLYDELYEESDFVFYAVDYVNDVEELETLLDGSNQTLLLKVLTILKEKQVLSEEHKNMVLNHITSPDIREIVEAL